MSLLQRRLEVLTDHCKRLSVANSESEKEVTRLRGIALCDTAFITQLESQIDELIHKLSKSEANLEIQTIIGTSLETHLKELREIK